MQVITVRTLLNDEPIDVNAEVQSVPRLGDFVVVKGNLRRVDQVTHDLDHGGRIYLRAGLMYPIEDGDSNEVCLAKTMLNLHAQLTLGDADSEAHVDTMISLLSEGVVYAGEVLNARSN